MKYHVKAVTRDATSHPLRACLVFAPAAARRRRKAGPLAIPPCCGMFTSCGWGRGEAGAVLGLGAGGLGPSSGRGLAALDSVRLSRPGSGLRGTRGPGVAARSPRGKGPSPRQGRGAQARTLLALLLPEHGGVSCCCGGGSRD